MVPVISTYLVMNGYVHLNSSNLDRTIKRQFTFMAASPRKRNEGRCLLEPGKTPDRCRVWSHWKDHTSVGNPLEVPTGYEERWLFNIHPIDTRGVVDAMGCTECSLSDCYGGLYQVTKKEITTKDELDGFKKHVTSLAALDFLVCLKPGIFVMTHGGNFAKLIISARSLLNKRGNCSTGSITSQAMADLPRGNNNPSELITSFDRKGLNLRDMDASVLLKPPM
ncbi:protein pectic arabinogalactan synthesis-related [Tanacetum coccineum]